MIFYDPTEARRGSRLPKAVQKAGVPLQKLEFATGADFMITPDSDVLGGDVTRPPTSLVFKRKLNEGCFLVQRKSGGDLLNSLPKLTNILWKMRLHGAQAIPWLLICGEFFQDRRGMVVCENRTTGWSWNAMQGAKDGWQILGGMIHEEYTDEMCGEWLMKWDNQKLRKLLDEKERGLQPRPIAPEIHALETCPQIRTLMTYPGVGEVLARRILEYCGDSLKIALWWMSLPNTHKKANAITGIGPKMRNGWRSWNGMGDDNEILVPLKDSQFVVEDNT